MKKSVVLAMVCAFVLSLGSVATADEIVPGASVHVDQSVMGVGQTMMQMGADDRAAASRVNAMSRTIMSAPGSAVNTDYQFGQSQSDQSWKQWKTVEDVGVVVGWFLAIAEATILTMLTVNKWVRAAMVI